MKLSVVIPTHNHEAFIESTLESVVKQRVNFDFEVLVGDDASSDQTPYIIKSFQKKYPYLIKPVFRETNIGGQFNRNDLYKRAQGELIAVLDGDDLMLPNKLQKQVDFLESNPDCDSAFHAMEIREVAVSQPKKARTVAGPLGSSQEIFSIADFVERGTFLPHSSKMFRRQALPESGFPVNTSAKGLDWLHHLITSKTGGVGYIDQILGVYRKHDASTTSQAVKGNLEPYFLGKCVALEYAMNSDVSSTSLDKGFARVFREFFIKALRLKDYCFYLKLLERYKLCKKALKKRHELFFLVGGASRTLFMSFSLLVRIRLALAKKLSLNFKMKSY